jgi:hypothetical protein
LENRFVSLSNICWKKAADSRRHSAFS